MLVVVVGEADDLWSMLVEHIAALVTNLAQDTDVSNGLETDENFRQFREIVVSRYIRIMRASTSIRKRIARVLNELTEIKIDLGQADFEIDERDVEYIVNEAQRIKAAADRISIKVLDLAEDGATLPLVGHR
jgi:hypothetical protein